MDGFDTSPIDARLMPKPVLPVANGAPAQPDTPAVLPRVPMQTSQPQQTQGLAFPQVGIQGRSPVQEKLASTQEQGSGISRIHNPVLKTLATVGDVLAGTFAPRAEQLIPGTEGNYALHLARAGNAVKGEQEQQAAQNEATLQRAQAHHAEAEANALENPQDKAPTNAIELFLKDPESFKAYQEASAKAQETKQPQFIKDGEGNLVGLIDPQGKIHSASDPNLDPETRAVMEAAKPKPQQPKTLIEKAIADHPEWKAEDLQAFLAKQPKEAQFSAEDQAIIKTVGGDPAVAISDQPPAILAKYLAKKKEAPPERPPQALMIGPNGQAMLVRPGTQVPTGSMTPSGVSTENETPAQVRSRQAQAEVIKTAGDQLITAIEQNRGKLGNLGSYWNKYTNGSPIADPATAALMAQLSSFAALQPALHGFRGAQALAEFEKVIGGVPKNPDALEAAIKAIQGTAGIVANNGREQTGGGSVHYREGTTDYDIPPDKVAAFEKSHPNAKKQ